jgi:hypothetical protein
VKAERIKQLLRFLPADSPYSRHLPRHTGAKLETASPRDVDVLANALNDTKFGWRFMRSFSEKKVLMPIDVGEPALRRAFAYEYYKHDDQPVREALAIEHPRFGYLRKLMCSLLLIPEMTWKRISELTHVSVEVVKLFEALFFNVRDRLDDQAYIASIVYPEGIQSEMREGYAIKEDIGFLMMRAAHRGGVDTLFPVAGLANSGARSEYNAGDSALRVESMIMSNAVLNARMGLLNQSRVPGLMHARSIIAATKQAGTQGPSADSQMGLSNIGLHRNVMNDLSKLQAPELEFRKTLRLQFIDQEQSAKEKKQAELAGQAP